MLVVQAQVDLKADRDRLIQTIRQKCGNRPVKAIMVDTLARALAGGDENSSVDMGELVKNCDTIRQAVGARIMVIHHSGKDAARGARGHSSLRAATDTEIEIVSLENIGTVSIKKQRDLEIIEPFAFRLKTITLGVDDRGNDVTSCVLEEAQPIAGYSGTLGPNEKLAVKALKIALEECGEIAPAGDHYPAHMRVVRVDTLHRYAAQVFPQDDDRRKKGACDRAVASLLTKGIVGKWSTFIWLAE